jgi:hypothetical protein
MCLTPASMVATALVYGEGSLRIKKQWKFDQQN